MTIIPLTIIICTVVELLLQVFALVYVSYGEQHCITTPIEHQKQCNSSTINADDNQSNASAQSQPCQCFYLSMRIQ
jgi:hypothetical protein